jgi:hypothetical protein
MNSTTKQTRINNDEERDVLNKQSGSPQKNILNSTKKINLNPNTNLLLACMKNNDYCFSLMDYMKKMMHFSQVDYYYAYTQLLYCFRPKEM